MTSLAPLLVPLPVLADASPQDEMADMSIEDLANIEVTSVSKKPEQLAGAAASVYVISADDIRRAGAASLPEALRLAPNLQVAQVSGFGYALSARGMNGSNNSAPNKLRVMVDGRSIYAPLFSGVAWDVQDVVMEDIDRIEVISGPGGTLWGVNAVNGVINITTKAASATHGSLWSLRAGSRGVDTALRYGAGNWRVYGKYLDRRHTERASGARVDDARHHAQVGFRGDWSAGGDAFSVHGNAYRAGAEQPAPGLVSVTNTPFALGPITSSGVNLTGRWERALDSGASLSLQAYLDQSKRKAVLAFDESLLIADLQFQHSLARSGMHALVWGASYRSTRDDVTNSEIIAFLPGKVSQTWASLFAQDELSLSDRLRLTLGARVERNPYTGAEFLPTARVAWTMSPNSSLWGGLSRTVRAPSRLDADAFIPGRPPFLLRGGPVVRSEVARVAELGYRGQPVPGMSFSVTAFYNRYDHLRTQEVDRSRTFVTFDSKMEGKASGIEMWGSYQAMRKWRLSAGLLALHQRFWLKPGSNDARGPGSARKDPSHTAQLRSTYNVADSQEFEVGLRKAGALANPAVPGYTALDARYGWRIRPGMELSLAGYNLNGSHGEYGALATRTEFDRSVALKLVWQM
ncbi:MAG: TonB-dependent receptor [Telluria sp.]|nr:TonB-dependent receptor [Telluria sp.]